jgi:hypothetical protein
MKGMCTSKNISDFSTVGLAVFNLHRNCHNQLPTYVRNLLNAKPKITLQFQGREEFHSHTHTHSFWKPKMRTHVLLRNWTQCFLALLYLLEGKTRFFLNLALKYVKYMNEAAPNQTEANWVTIKQTLWRQTKACITKSHANSGRTEHD